MSKYEVILLDSNNFAVVMITSHGSVKTKKTKVSEIITEESVQKLTALLNTHLCGLSADMINLPLIVQMEKAMGADGAMVNAAVKCIYDVMSEIDGGELRYSGINNLLNYPEYSDTQQLGRLLGTLEEQDEILDLVSDAENDDINVLIVSESSVKVMNNSSLVFKPIKKNGRTVGVIGVLGPLRMDYKNVLKTIDEIGGSISDMIKDNKELKEGNKNDG
jgi:heat-inducible transcriptional repressor